MKQAFFKGTDCLPFDIIKVLGTLLQTLLFFSIGFLAFALSFFVLLHKVTQILHLCLLNDQDLVKDHLPSNATLIGGGGEEEERYPYFNGPWLSLIKVFTMFIGELEFSDLPINLDSDLAPVTFSFLVFFVLVMVITLMNLLNGLAVSDVGKLEENAELVSFNSR